MVRVLDGGRDPAMVKKCSCPHCAARLEYVRKDVQSWHGTDYGGGSAGREWIVCPNCGDEVTLRNW